jgi:RNA polymerase sigma-70 factor (ECF subfamily)
VKKTTARHDEGDELVDQLVQGDHHALAAIFARNQSRLRNLVARRLDARLSARVSPSDVLQESFVDALKRLRHFQADPDVPVFVWLRSVTIQRLIDMHREHLGALARDADREVPIASVDTRSAGSETMAAAFLDPTSPSEDLERAEAIARVREALQSLDPTDREIITLRHLEELNNREAAALLGILPAAASKRHVRALARLRDVVAKLMGPNAGPESRRGECHGPLE